MAKYRILNTEELQELEKEFIEFLVLNGITADDWKQIQQEDQEKAQKVIELFSDVVFEGIIRKTNFLNYRSDQKVRAYQCLQEKMIVIGYDPQVGSKEEANILYQEIPYSNSREETLFAMMNAGFEKSDGRLFKELQLLRVSKMEMS